MLVGRWWLGVPWLEVLGKRVQWLVAVAACQLVLARRVAGRPVGLPGLVVGQCVCASFCGAQRFW